MRGYQNRYVYEEHEYPEYAPQGGPTRNYGPPAHQQPQPASNLFLPGTVQPAPVVSSSQKRNSRKKRRGALMSTTPVPTTQVLPKLPADPSPSTQQLAPPGKKWVLMEDTAPASVPPATVQPPTPEPSKPEPELADITADLKAAQTAVNRMQLIIEAAWFCLLEQWLRHPIEKIGILEAYIPQKKIEVLAGATTLGTIIISGLEYLKYYGLPSTGEGRLLGRCGFLKFNSDGMLHNFKDLSKLSPQVQAEKLEKNRLAVQGTVADFLAHFAGSETFYQRPEVTAKLGIPPTVLQMTMMDC